MQGAVQSMQKNGIGKDFNKAANKSNNDAGWLQLPQRSGNKGNGHGAVVEDAAALAGHAAAAGQIGQRYRCCRGRASCCRHRHCFAAAHHLPQPVAGHNEQVAGASGGGRQAQRGGIGLGSQAQGGIAWWGGREEGGAGRLGGVCGGLGRPKDRERGRQTSALPLQCACCRLHAATPATTPCHPTPCAHLCRPGRG